MTITSLFWLFFSMTLGSLGAALLSGFTGRRRMHLVTAPLTVALLVVTVIFAEQLAGERVFPPDEMRIHLWFAKSAGLLVLPVGASGVWLWRKGRGRKLHLVCVVLFVLAALSATGTGVWVFGLSTPK